MEALWRMNHDDSLVSWMVSRRQQRYTVQRFSGNGSTYMEFFANLFGNLSSQDYHYDMKAMSMIYSMKRRTAIYTINIMCNMELNFLSFVCDGNDGSSLSFRDLCPPFCHLLRRKNVWKPSTIESIASYIDIGNHVFH